MSRGIVGVHGDDAGTGVEGGRDEEQGVAVEAVESKVEFPAGGEVLRVGDEFAAGDLTNGIGAVTDPGVVPGRVHAADDLLLGDDRRQVKGEEDKE